MTAVNETSYVSLVDGTNNIGKFLGFETIVPTAREVFERFESNQATMETEVDQSFQGEQSAKWIEVLKLPENNENAVKVAFCFAVAFARTLQDLKVKQSDIKKLDIVKIQAADGGKETGEGEEGEASPEEEGKETKGGRAKKGAGKKRAAKEPAAKAAAEGGEGVATRGRKSTKA